LAEIAGPESPAKPLLPSPATGDMILLAETPPVKL